MDDFSVTFEGFVMFVNVGVSELVFITVHCTGYEFSTAIFIEF